MKRIFFISRTYSKENSGGGIIRKGQICHLRNCGYRVVEVALSDENKVTEDCILVKGPKSLWSVRIYVFLVAIGVLSDYLEPWANRAFKLLRNIINKDDIILATSGGEFGTLILAVKIKERIGCNTILNLHDPIQYTLIDGHYLYKSKYVFWNRDRVQEKVFNLADKIVTSTLVYRNALMKRYPSISSRISCHHFGYVKDYGGCFEKLVGNKKINIVYGGSAGKYQKAEILIDIAILFPDIQFTFIGNMSFIEKDCPPNVVIMPLMSHDKYIRYMQTNADIGFLSLVGNHSLYCVPSKLYGYISLGLPILACIDGDARSIINDNEFGIATDYNVDSLAQALQSMLIDNNYLKNRQNIMQKRSEWYMGRTILELVKVIENC